MVHRPGLNRRASGDDGVVLIMVGLLMIAILIAAAFVIDLGNARQVSRQSQSGVDAAALASAQALPSDGSAATTSSTDPAFATAANYVADNLFDGGSTPAPTPTGCNTPTETCTFTIGTGSQIVTVTVTTPYQGNNHLVYVNACRSTPTYFAGAAGRQSPDVCRSAVARKIMGTSIPLAGVIALRTTAPCVDYSLSGSVASTLHVQPGAVIANCLSSPPNTLNGSNAGIDASSFYSVGTCTNPANCVGPNSTPTVEIASPVPDPLSGLPAPSPTDPSFIRLTASAYNGLSCLNGFYDVTDGAGSGASIDMIPTCAGATSFTYLRNIGVSTNLKSEVDQSCPTSGTYSGVCLFLARGNTSTINWNGNSNGLAVYNGTVYAPDGSINWGGNIDVVVNGQVIAQTYLLHGGGGPKNQGFVVNVPASTATIVLPPDIGLEK